METKLRRWIIGILVGTVLLTVAMIFIWKLKFYDDVTTKIAAINKDGTGTLATYKTSADKLKVNLLAEAVAKDRAKLAANELRDLRVRFRSLRFENKDEPALNQTWIGYMNEYFSDFGTEIGRQLRSAARESNVVLNTTLKVSSPPQTPEAVAIPNSGFLTPVNSTDNSITVDVTGDFVSIQRFLRRINQSQILMSIGAIKLEGASPNIKATFTITPFLVARGEAIKLVAGAGAGTTAPAATDGSGDGTTATTPVAP